MVVESLGFDSFLVKLDGSGHLTRRNRQFLRKFTPFLLTKLLVVVKWLSTTAILEVFMVLIPISLKLYGF